MVKYCEFFSLLTHRERRMAIVANSTATPCTAVKQVPTIDIHLVVNEPEWVVDEIVYDT